MSKSLLINNYSKCNWIEFSHQKSKSGSMDNKQDPTICSLQENHFNSKDIDSLKAKGW